MTQLRYTVQTCSQKNKADAGMAKRNNTAKQLHYDGTKTTTTQIDIKAEHSKLRRNQLNTSENTTDKQITKHNNYGRNQPTHTQTNIEHTRICARDARQSARRQRFPCAALDPRRYAC